MSIHGISDKSTLTDLYQSNLLRSGGVGSTDNNLMGLLTDSNTSQSAVDSIVLSPKGQIYSRLKQMQATDPAKFKQMCAQIAAGLRAAQGIGGSGGSALAQRFENAADSGSMADISLDEPTRASSDGSKLVDALKKYYTQHSGDKNSTDPTTEKILAVLRQAGVSI